MEESAQGYKCPCCDAPIRFSAASGKMKCDYCDSELDIETVKAYNESGGASFEGEIPSYQSEGTAWEEDGMGVFSCPFCGASLVTDQTTAASQCPYCGNNMIFESRLSGSFKPDLVIPFRVTKEEAENALKRFYEGKFFLPKSFRSENRIKELKGVYVPFWLYDCKVDARFSYDASKSITWSDRRYLYTRTDHYLVERGAVMRFERIPADGSTKADDAYMEALEPFDYEALVPFDKAFLSGFLADQYDVDSAERKDRVESRTGGSADRFFRESLGMYDGAVERKRSLRCGCTSVKYALMPVWMLTTSYRGKRYRFAMNGQTGKLVGEMPCDPVRYWLTFAVTAGIVMALGSLLLEFLAERGSFFGSLWF